MHGEELPEDLAELEGRLAATRRAPSPQLRGRVLGAICREGAGGAGLWRFAAAVAAVLALCLNLGMSAANHMDWGLRGPRPRTDVAAQVRRLRDVVPDLSERDARAIVISMEGSRSLIPVPDLGDAGAWQAGLAATAYNQPGKETTDGLRTAVD